jgi:hypothetical protein
LEGPHTKEHYYRSCDTGQAGSINFDEVRAKLYKLHRACRIGPETRIDPAEPVAFYAAPFRIKL